MFKNIVLAIILVFAFGSVAYCDEIDTVLDTSTSGGTCSGGTCKLPSGN